MARLIVEDASRDKVHPHHLYLNDNGALSKHGAGILFTMQSDVGKPNSQSLSMYVNLDEARQVIAFLKRWCPDA